MHDKITIRTKTTELQRTLLLLTALAITTFGCRAKKTRFVTIGTGAVTGIYYPTGGAIGQLVNRKFATYGIKVTVESTSGSVFNVNAVSTGDLDFGIVQSDRQYQAYHGLAEWAETGPRRNLRSVFSLHPEAVTLVVAEHSGIRTLSDLKGKRINLGNPGSGHLQNSRDVLAAAGIDEQQLFAEYVKAVEAPGLLQDGRIDGFFYTVGHPNSNVEEASYGRIKVFIVPITDPVRTELLRRHPYYAKAVIPRSYYPRILNETDIETIGVKTTVVTSKDVPADVVYAVVKEVFDNLDQFKTLHAAYKNLTPQQMLAGLSAPLHPGALRYYREVGLDKYIDPKLIPQP